MYSTLDDMLAVNLVKNISWPSDNLFDADDVADIRKNVSISEADANILTTAGKTKDTADSRQLGMWIKANASVSTTGKEEVSSYFDNIYSKLSCCLGSSEVSVPIIKQKADGDTEVEYVTIKVEGDDCKINGIDWYDDNTTTAGHNLKCDYLMQRLIAFLEKYNPDSPMIEKYGGCFANRFIYDEMGNNINPALYNMIDSNRSCSLVSKCQQDGEAYLRKQDRHDCALTFCQSTTTFDNLTAGEKIKIQPTIEQQCGPNSAIRKKQEEEQDADWWAKNTGDGSGTTDSTSGTTPSTTESTSSTTESTSSTTESTPSTTESTPSITKSSTSESTPEAAGTSDSKSQPTDMKKEPEDKEEEPVEEVSFWSRIWNWFASLFGGGKKEEFHPQGTENKQTTTEWVIAIVLLLVVVLVAGKALS